MSGYVTINKQQIPWSFIHKVAKALGNDWDRTADCFYKARNADNIVRYVSKGFTPDAKGERYSLLPSSEREQRGMEPIRQWWASLHQPANRPMVMADIMRGIVEGRQ